MSYLVLARKYRPAGFNTVSGQEHVTRTLSNAITRDKVVHAYLFTGPRGVGKTSVARILSKAINCQATKKAKPCQECETCREISAGTSLAIREIDGASHNSVDNVRDLMDSFKALPPPGYRYKVYIIDEVHMLSLSAFNALLKSLEEPPPNTVFILATTEIHKIPETVISRCQRHDFRSLSVDVIEARLVEVCASEGIKVEREALTAIARLADGSMRDAQTLLDRVQTFCDGAITAAETSRALGSVERAALVTLGRHIVQRDVPGVLQSVSDLFSTGIDPATLLREFTNFWRELFIAKLGGEGRLRSLGLSEDSVVEILRLVSPLDVVDIQDLWDLAREGADRCFRGSHSRYGFEALTVRLATRLPVQEIGELVGQALVSTSGHVTAAKASAAPTPQLRAHTEKGSAEASNTVSAQPVEAPTRASTEGVSLDWVGFLAHVSEKGGKILLENLKRMKPVRFEAGLLEGTGPEFTVNSLSREEGKMRELLAAFVGQPSAERWKVTFKKGVGAADSAVAAARDTAAQQAQSIEAHPALQSLQKIFPGSKVEQVRVKNS